MERDKPLEVAAGLVFRRDRLLITRRRAQDPLGGLWEFPGGKRHREESFPDCLRRELMEELGIEVEVGELVEDIVHAYPAMTVRLKFFRCLWLRHEPRALGCAQFKWVWPEDLSRYAFPPADARLLEKLIHKANVPARELRNHPSKHRPRGRDNK